MKKKYSHIIWDWNGTLLNDVVWCIEIMNSMLIKRGITPLLDVHAYHEVFCFPIIEYYKNVGFDFGKESFENLAMEFIDAYHSNQSGNSKLYTNAEFILKWFYKNEMTQIILSASKADNLLRQLGEFNINHYFDALLGLSDVYAKSKVEIGLDYMVKNKIKNALMIGDTIHDYEVSLALGVDCLLISAGHQSKETLLSCGVPVLDDLADILELIEL